MHDFYLRHPTSTKIFLFHAKCRRYLLEPRNNNIPLLIESVTTIISLVLHIISYYFFNVLLSSADLVLIITRVIDLHQNNNNYVYNSLHVYRSTRILL